MDAVATGKTIMLLSLIAHRKLHNIKTPSSPPTVSPPSASSVTSAKASGGRAGKTLIVCPLSLLHQWKNEVEERFRPRTLSVLVFYGDERGSGALSIKSDVVLTTYGVLCCEFEKATPSSVLLSTHWDRVILDEAHSIKNRSTTYFRACSALRATHRWCLTGTPLQNSLSDLFSLLCFLRYEPWSRVAWWQRVIARPFEQGDEDAITRLKVLLKPMLLRRTKRSRDADGNSIVDLPPKTVELVRLQFSDEERAFYQAVYDRSRAEFNGFVASGTSMTSYIAIFALLLRLRQACNHPFLALGRDSQLAESTGKTGGSDGASSHALRLERHAGESVESYFGRISKRLHDDAAAVEANTTATISSTGDAPLSSQYVQNVLTQIQEEGIDAQECPVCLDPPRCGVLTPCAHLLCADCLRESVASDPDGGCPVCRTPVDMSKVIEISMAVTASPAAQTAADGSDHSDKDAGDDSSSSSLFLSAKLRRLLKDMQAIREQDAVATHAAGGDAVVRRKVVVFSQWTHMLEMVAELLAKHNFRSCMFHGALNQETREKVLRKFRSDPEMDVLVVSLKAGGVGLNLTCASVVVLLDPWWNPGVEDQAIDRVHRLGQTREVVVKRYVVDETVEEMILQLQERKERLAKNVLVAAKAGDDRASERLGMENLLAFFK
jgi:DNA repair protein RAD5